MRQEKLVKGRFSTAPGLIDLGPFGDHFRVKIEQMFKGSPNGAKSPKKGISKWLPKFDAENDAKSMPQRV